MVETILTFTTQTIVSGENEEECRRKEAELIQMLEAMDFSCFNIETELKNYPKPKDEYDFSNGIDRPFDFVFFRGKYAKK